MCIEIFCNRTHWGPHRFPWLIRPHLFLFILFPTLWVMTSCTNALVDTGPGEAEGAAGAPAGRDTPPPKSIHITPTTVALETGEACELSLWDDLGRPVHGASWSVGNSLIAGLSNAGGIKLAGRVPGRVAVKATYRGMAAEAPVEVFFWWGPPPGTLSWSLRPMPGFSAGLILRAPVSGEDTPAIYVVEVGGTRGWLVRALTIYGAQLWLAHLDTGANTVPLAAEVHLPAEKPAGDSSGSPAPSPASRSTPAAGLSNLERLLGARGDTFGGIYLGFADERRHTSLIRFDGLTGRESWRYASPGYLYPHQTMTHRGMLYVVENLDPPSSQATLLGIEGRTGKAVQRIPLPPSLRGVRNAKCRPGANQIVSSHSQGGAPMTAENGSVYLEVEVTKNISNDLPCNQGGALSVDNSLRLLRVKPDGSYSWRTLKRYTFEGPRNSPQGRSLPRARVGEVIPDGRNGLLAAWTYSIDYPKPPLEARVTHVSDSSQTEYTLPLPGWGGAPWIPPGRTLALGEQGTAFAAYVNKVVAFDLASGAVKWTWEAASCEAYMEAASSGGGIVLTVCGRVVRLDSNGQATYDAWTGGPPQGAATRRRFFSRVTPIDLRRISMLQYNLGRQWLAIQDSDLPGSGASAVAISAPPILWPFSVWP